ncbi:MAG TPA: serine hydrolase domain-containing protein [Acidimicrobiales bacterium]|nr:serine hydrolase domain-containing protein [Acidimicrobiales bacterium]
MDRLRGHGEGGHENHPMGDTGLARDLLGLIERFAGGYVGLSVGAIVGHVEAAVSVGRTGPGGASPGRATTFQIGSVTKALTSLLLADAVQRGDVALDQRLDSIFPGTATHPDGQPITLVDLATHTSGLPRLPPGLWHRALRTPKDPYSDLTREQVVEGLRRPPKRPAGRRYVYSNYGAGVLGEAMARACGRSYAELLSSRITEPLGLNDTTVERQVHAMNIARGHSRRGRPVPDWHLAALEGAGALRSTASDLLVFLRAHLHLGHSALEDPIRTVVERRWRVREGLHVALGWHVLEHQDDSAWWWHNGGTGGFFSFVAFDPSTATGVAVLSNSARSVDRLGMAIMEDLRPRCPT